MARVEKYRETVEKVIQNYSKLFQPRHPEVEVQTIFDREGNHYQLSRFGWHEDKNYSGCVMHLDIKNGKIWIQYDGTEQGVANDLVEMGVPKEDIVLAYHAPYKRKYTGFAEN
jgi:hypothetical protein